MVITVTLFFCSLSRTRLFLNKKKANTCNCHMILELVVINPCPRIACGRVKVVNLLISMCVHVLVKPHSHSELFFLQRWTSLDS